MLTPQTTAKNLAKKIGLNVDLYLKREDLHPYGSHKGRSIPVMIAGYLQAGESNFCISSSGNAAIAAALTINEYNNCHSDGTFASLSVNSGGISVQPKCHPELVSGSMASVDEMLKQVQHDSQDRDPSSLGSLGMTKKLNLKIFVGKNINNEKLEAIENLLNQNVVLEKVSNPKQSAFQMDKTGSAKNLRQSTDDTALIGYEALADELTEIKNLAAVFIPTSSGTTAQALHEEFKKLKLNPQIHIVQTTFCHPIVGALLPASKKPDNSPSIAGAIVDKIARRKEKVVEAIKASKGNAWICADQEIKIAMALVKKTEEMVISPNSALSLAGLIQAIKTGHSFSGAVVCIFTGR